MNARPAKAAKRHDGRYHHGRLKAAMVEATVALVEELGAEQVSVREAARRAGVSSGAPFRHFPTRAALLTAAAEEAMRRFRLEIAASMARVADKDPLVRLYAVGLAYVRWALGNPTLYEILGNRRTLDLAGSQGLSADIGELHALVVDLLTKASAQGLLRSDDIFNLTLNVRTLAYGMARMYVDRQLTEWGIEDMNAEAVMAGALRHYLRGLAAEPDRHDLTV